MVRPAIERPAIEGTEMAPAAALRTRLATQRLSSAPLPRAADVVRLLTCVQAQERDHALFSLGMRTRRATYRSVRAELDAGRLLRTHILRPTWHFVAPEDVRWILELTSPRVEAGMSARNRQLGLDDAARVDRGMGLLSELLVHRNALTRIELGRAFADHGSPIAPGEPLGHLLLLAELRGLICSGPTKGLHHSYLLVDEVVPARAQMDRDLALAELARRFFLGHGPASIQDFARWSSLTLGEIKAAVADLGDELATVRIDGVDNYLDPAAPPRAVRAARAYLFPAYDEAVLTYPRVRFPVADGHPGGGAPDPFWAAVVVDARNVGRWKRTVTASAVKVRLELAGSVSDDDEQRIHAAAEGLATFWECELDYAVDG